MIISKIDDNDSNSYSVVCLVILVLWCWWKIGSGLKYEYGGDLELIDQIDYDGGFSNDGFRGSILWCGILHSFA